MAAEPEDWKNYDDFALGIDTNRLPATDALAGKEFRLTLADGTTFEQSFVDASTVEWRADGESGRDWYEAVEVDDTTYFVDMTFAARPREALTVIANLATRHALAVFAEVAEQDTPGEPRVRQRFVTGVVGDPQGAPAGSPPAPTRDLIGRRILYRYSPHHVYEHVYLSSERYSWQCLVGVQRGHGDTDLTTTYSFGEDRYLFAFREFRIPVASLFFYNMDTLRSTGKFLGVTSEGRIENSRAGAFIVPLGSIEYPPGEEPV